jgi:hypothetical protein
MPEATMVADDPRACPPGRALSALNDNWNARGIVGRFQPEKA